MPVTKTHLDADQRGVAFLCQPLTEEERRDLNLFMEREDFAGAVAIEGEDKVVYRLPAGTDEVAHAKIGHLEEYLNGLQAARPHYEDEASDMP
ncbi:MAG TPA: hypothetical protein VF475_14460 [Sphingobium sp.]